MRAIIEQSRGTASAAAAPYTVSKVFADKPDAPGLKVARELGVGAEALDAADFGGREAFDSALAAAIGECAPSLIALAGFMRILSAQFVTQFAGKILNIHPSLLPKFPGLHTHRRALEAHETEHGATVHFVTEQLDAGPAIIQGRIAVRPDDDEASLAARVQAAEHRIYPLAVHWFCAGRLRYRDEKAWLDGRVLQQPVQYKG